MPDDQDLRLSFERNQVMFWEATFEKGKIWNYYKQSKYPDGQKAQTFSGERFKVPNDFNQVTIRMEPRFKTENGVKKTIYQPIGFSKLQIWCGEALVADFVEDGGCETLWFGGGHAGNEKG